MNGQLKRLFSFQTRNALHIRPPPKLLPKDKVPFLAIRGKKLPIFHEIPINFTPVPPPDAKQFDDALPENHIGVQVTSSSTTHLQELITDYRETKIKVPFTFEDAPKVPFTSFTVTSREYQTSVKKASVVLAMTVGQYLYDALMMMEAMEKKIGRLAAETIRGKVFEEIEERRLDPKYLWLSSVIVNRKRRVKSIRYHARGRAGVKKRDFCVIKFTVSERPLREFYKSMIIGKAPPYLAYLLRQELLKKEPNFEEVRNLQPLLHSRGRQQQRLMFRRKVMTRWIELRKQGFPMRLKLLNEKMLEEEAKTFEERFGYLFESMESKYEKRLAARREMFEKNQKEFV